MFKYESAHVLVRYGGTDALQGHLPDRDRCKARVPAVVTVVKSLSKQWASKSRNNISYGYLSHEGRLLIDLAYGRELGLTGKPRDCYMTITSDLHKIGRYRILLATA
jgi:hypothetical protein